VIRPWRMLPLALLLLGGCGMYGPLFLVEETPAPEITETPPIAGDAAAAPVEPAPPEPVDDVEDEADPEGGS
jgi:hypothetical protein